MVRLVMKDTVDTRMAKMLATKYGDKTPTNESNTENASTSGAMVGSMNSDKAVILGEEFDLLFGYERSAGEPRPNNLSGNNDVAMEDLLRQAGTAGTADREADGSDMETGEI